MTQRQIAFDIRQGPEALPPGYSLSQLPNAVRPVYTGTGFRGSVPYRVAFDPRGRPATNMQRPKNAVAVAPQDIPRMASEIAYSTAPVQSPWGMAPISTAPTRSRSGKLLGEGGAGRPPQ